MFKTIYKRYGISSFKAIDEFKKENRISKIGHTGTLDPLAQGLLLVAIDEGTKLIEYIQNKDKEYNVVIKLGYSSKTYDLEGPIKFNSFKIPTKEEIIKIINSFIGNIKQKPPIFSAKKINGKKAYELARENKKVNIKKINVTIYEIKNIKYSYPFISFSTTVSNGTYIRSLVNDIGKKLKTGAYMIYLERTMVNGIKINDEINIKKFLNIKTTKINSRENLLDLINGKTKYYKINDGNYLLEFNNQIVGLIEVKNNQIIKNKLFGKKINSLIKQGEWNV